jgi:putative membrane protein
MRSMPTAAGVLVLATAWLGPLPELSGQSFAAHMAMHMAVVAIAAPLIAFGVSGSAVDPSRRRPDFFAPIQASFVELAIVWAWHVPTFHHAARHHTPALVLEQASFIAAGLLLWLSVLGGGRERGGAGVAALLFTSMHMTLLGALFALAPRPLYSHDAGNPAWSAIADQHLGGAIMLLVGGASYLAGGLLVLANLVKEPAAGSRRLLS